MTLSIVSAFAVRENIARVTFDVQPYFSGVLDPGDASEIDRWSIVADPASLDGEGVPPRAVAPARVTFANTTQLDVWLDRRLSSFPARYTIKATGLLTADLSSGLAVSEATFIAVRAGAPPFTPDAGISNADIANPQSLEGMLGQLPILSEGVLGTWPVDDTGDIAKDSGLVSYKKRVIRRLTTRKDRYAHLPGYGTLLPSSIKQLARPGLAGQLEADAEDQIRQEPETLAVRVRVEQIGSVAYFRVRVRCSLGSTFDLSVAIAPGT